MNPPGIDTTNMCSHLRHKLMDADGVYHQIWQTLNDDPELTAVVRSRQLHIYRNGKKVFHNPYFYDRLSYLYIGQPLHMPTSLQLY